MCNTKTYLHFSSEKSPVLWYSADKTDMRTFIIQSCWRFFTALSLWRQRLTPRQPITVVLLGTVKPPPRARLRPDFSRQQNLHRTGQCQLSHVHTITNKPLTRTNRESKDHSHSVTPRMQLRGFLMECTETSLLLVTYISVFCHENVIKGL